MNPLSKITLLCLAALEATAVLADGPYRGFCMGANRNSDNQCKGVDDWRTDFNRIKGWGPFNAVRLYSTAQCNQLDSAAQAAKDTGIKIFVGIWSGGAREAVDQEFTALDSAIAKYGTDWIAAVSCGSEDRYRNDVTVDEIVRQIGEAKGKVSQHGIKVTHVDTWTAWVDGANARIIEAVDFLTHNSFPYWEGAASDLDGTFFRALDRTKGAAGAKAALTWVGETGNPTSGANFAAAVPSITTLQGYWHNVACNLEHSNANFFWFRDTDAPFASSEVEKSFGVADKDGKPKFDLAC